MNDMRQLARMANRIREALTPLRHSRYKELSRQMTTLTDRLQQVSCGSRKVRIAVERGWLAARGGTRADLVGD